MGLMAVLLKVGVHEWFRESFILFFVGGRRLGVAFSECDVQLAPNELVGLRV